jgi:hypothetical protein
MISALDHDPEFETGDQRNLSRIILYLVTDAIHGGLMLLALLLSAGSTALAADAPPKVSPFSAVRWKEHTPEVHVQDVWYELLAIDDLNAADIVASCQRHRGRRWQKRFEQDLVSVLKNMGHTPQVSVMLRLRDLSAATIHTLEVRMTRENRRRLLRARKRSQPTQSKRLTASQARADLDQLQELLEQRFAYATRFDVDFVDRIARLKKHAASGIDANTFALQLRRLIATFGDGHSRVRGWATFLPQRHLPFAVDVAEDRLVALRADRSDLLDPKRPFIHQIDGLDVSTWLGASAALVAKGSPQFIRRGAVDVLHYIQFVRTEMDRTKTVAVTVHLVDATGTDRRAKVLQVSPRPPLRRPTGPAFEHRMLAQDIAYLALRSMDRDEAFMANLRRAMEASKPSRGLIIDVRGNGGGSRNAMIQLLPYFIGPDTAPRVVNAAVYRLQPEDRPDRLDGYLADRFLRPLTYARWSPAERGAIDAFATTFNPEWAPPAAGFSELHFLVMSRKNDAQTYYYDRPVVVLIDDHCFSATDIFAGAFKGWPGITLMGTATGGGSGRARQYVLEHSGLRVKLSSMVSYQPDGRLYDGHGVQPDIEVIPTVGDILGKTDTVLEKAMAHITSGAP